MAVRKLSLAKSYDDFLAQPLGRYFVDARILTWALTADFCGFTFWGTTNRLDIDRLLRPIEMYPPTMGAKINVLVNVRRIESIDLTMIDELGAALRARHDEYVRRVERVALVRPVGFTSALAAGIGNLLMPLPGWQVVESQEAALEWLGKTAFAPKIDAIERLANEALGQSPELVPLRTWMATQPEMVTLDAAASALGQSRRSLQRMLASIGTSFKDETDRHRLLLAQRLLAEGDDKLEAIALQLGFSSLSAFGVFYRRMTGESPSRGRRAIKRR